MPNQKKEKPIEKIQEAAHNTAETETATPVERDYRSILFQVGLGFVIIAFAVLAFFARTTTYFPIDLQITLSLQAINNPFISYTMRVISWPGYFPQSVIITMIIAGLFYFFGLDWEALMSMFAVVVDMVINTLVKVIVQRVRPGTDLVHVVEILKSYSFPSGHVMFYTVFFGFVWFLVYSLLRKSWIRSLLLAIFGALILTIGISRIFLGEHWASDVVGAYLLGTLTLVINIWVYRWGKHRFFTHQPVAGENGQNNHERNESN